MPKLWSETIEKHRSEVYEAVLDATARLVGENGLLNVTMSQIAEQAGIGRPTLYKYFPSIEEILQAWHQRQVDAHLKILTEAANENSPGHERLANVLRTYAHLQQHRTNDHSTQNTEHDRALHNHDRLAPATLELHSLIQKLITEAGDNIRTDIKADELATYCLHALAAAHEMNSHAAANRLVDLIIQSLQTS